MKLLVISDSHGRTANFERILKAEEPFDYLLHCGDLEGDEEVFRRLSCPIAMVAGNMDFFSELQRELVLPVSGHRILLVHGHRERVSESLLTLACKAAANDCDIVCFGHTHVPVCTVEKGITFLNPGSISKPRQEGHRPSYAVLELSEGKTAEASVHFL